jgi:hypothetical protein
MSDECDEMCKEAVFVYFSYIRLEVTREYPGNCFPTRFKLRSSQIECLSMKQLDYTVCQLVA